MGKKKSPRKRASNKAANSGTAAGSSDPIPTSPARTTDAASADVHVDSSKGSTAEDSAPKTEQPSIVVTDITEKREEREEESESTPNADTSASGGVTTGAEDSEAVEADAGSSAAGKGQSGDDSSDAVSEETPEFAETITVSAIAQIPEDDGAGDDSGEQASAAVVDESATQAGGSQDDGPLGSEGDAASLGRNGRYSPSHQPRELDHDDAAEDDFSLASDEHDDLPVTRESMDLLREERSHLATQLDSASKTSMRYSRDRDELTSEIAELRARNDALARELRVGNNTQRTPQAAYVSSPVALGTQSPLSIETEREIATLRALWNDERDTLRRQNDELRIANTRLEGEVSQLKRRCDELQFETVHVKTLQAESDIQLQKRSKDKTDLLSRLQDAMKEKSDALLKVSQLESELHIAHMTIESLNVDLSNIEVERDAVQGERDRLMAASKTLLNVALCGTQEMIHKFTTV